MRKIIKLFPVKKKVKKICRLDPFFLYSFYLLSAIHGTLRNFFFAVGLEFDLNLQNTWAGQLVRVTSDMVQVSRKGKNLLKFRRGQWMITPSLSNSVYSYLSDKGELFLPGARICDSSTMMLLLRLCFQPYFFIQIYSQF